MYLGYFLHADLSELTCCELFLFYTYSHKCVNAAQHLIVICFTNYFSFLHFRMRPCSQ